MARPPRQRARNGKDGEKRTMAITANTDIPAASPARAGRVPLAVAVFIVALMIPTAATIYVGTVQLNPMKVLMVVLTVVCGLSLLARRLYLHDWLFLAFVGWGSMCLLLNYGAGGITLMGLFASANVGGYALAVTAFSRTEDIVRTTRVLIFCAAGLGVLAIPENISHVNYLQDAISAYTDFWPKLQTDFRAGLLRASSVFSHPIMYGTFCAALLSFGWYTARSGAGIILGVVLVIGAALTALSSGPLLVVMLQLALILTERYTRTVKNRFQLFAAIAVTLFVMIDLASDRGPVKLVLSYLTFNTHTAYYRLLIWDNGIDDVMRNPIFGFRPELWTRLYWMTSSVDNFWLFTAMRSGIPGAALLLASVVAVLVSLFRLPDAALPEGTARIRRAAAYALAALCVCGMTVHFFGKIEPLFAFYLGIAAAVDRIARREAAAGGQRAPLTPRPARVPRPRTVL